LTSEDKEVEYILKEVRTRKGIYWNLGKGLCELYFLFQCFLQPFFHFVHIHPNVPIFIYERPIMPPDNLKNEHEKLLAKYQLTNEKINNILKEKKSLPIEKMFFDYTDEEIIATTQLLPSYKDINGVKKFNDFHKGRVNYQNGKRVTVFQPKEYDRTCYIVGSCVGLMTQIDEHTSASWLQKMFNEAGKRIRVENYHACVFFRHEETINILFNIPVKDNDIVIFELHEPIWSIAKNYAIYNKVILKTGELFYKPHKYGEVFFECFYGSHYNGNGAHELADELFAHIVRKNYFDGVNNFELYKGLIPENYKPINQYGTPRNQSENINLSTENISELISYKTILTQTHEKLFGKIGSIVMNCNPFTLGHRYLIEWAANQVKHLYIFAVEEDKSIFPFADRFELIKKGTADLPNVTVLPSGKFIISSITFQDYFNKAELQDRTVDPSMDISLFGKEIAPVLNIKVRFAGEEPLDKVTKQYNDTMRQILPDYGIEFVEIPRKEFNGEAISASRVRKLLEEKKFDEIEKLVPATTLEYLLKFSKC